MINQNVLPITIDLCIIYNIYKLYFKYLFVYYISIVIIKYAMFRIQIYLRQLLLDYYTL